MHPDLHTDLDNLDSVENNLRHSAKGSLDTTSSVPSQREDRFLRRKTDRLRDLQILPGHYSVDNYADLFTIVLRNDDIQEFDSKWDIINDKNPI